MRVIASVYIDRYSTGGYDPSDSWSRDSSDGHISEVTVRAARDNEPYGSYQYSEITEEVDLEVSPGDVVFVVTASYMTGDTFGSDFAANVMDVFKTSEEAYALVTDLESGHEYSVEHNGKNYYRSWEGYFEYLRSIDIHTEIVRA